MSQEGTCREPTTAEDGMSMVSKVLMVCQRHCTLLRLCETRGGGPQRGDQGCCQVPPWNATAAQGPARSASRQRAQRRLSATVVSQTAGYASLPHAGRSLSTTGAAKPCP